ncbi:cytochrome bd oxidase small subunit, CydX/CbdX family [uncultured Gilliamella sp.]
MYYVLWFVGIIAVCMLAVITGLRFEHINNESESGKK